MDEQEREAIEEGLVFLEERDYPLAATLLRKLVAQLGDTQPAPKELTFDDCLTTTEKRYRVPPDNSSRISVSHNLGNRRWYTGIEDFDRVTERWVHRRGESSGFATEPGAHAEARRLWQNERGPIPNPRKAGKGPNHD